MTQSTSGNDFRGLAMISTVVAEMVVPILIGVWLDNRYGWTPWGMTIGAVLGLVGGVGHLIVLARRSEKRDETSTRDRP
jgi:ATP synthase protein I